MNRTVLRIQIGAALIAWFALPACPGRGDEPTLATVLATWTARESQIETLRVQLTVNVVQLGESLPLVVNQPSHDERLDYKSTRILILDRLRRMRYEYTRKVWDQRGNVVDQLTTEACDGETRKMLFGRGNQDFPSLHISPDDMPKDARQAQLIPLNFVYRALSAASGLDRSRLSLDPRPVVVDGHKCLVVTQRPVPEEPVETTLWVDAERQYVPLRYLETHLPRTLGEGSISYSHDDKFGWVPRSWSIAFGFTAGGIPRYTEKAVVARYKFNEKLSDVAFQLDPLPNSYVNNYIANEQYIYRGDGTKRPILPGEYNGKNFDELLKTESLQPGKK